MTWKCPPRPPGYIFLKTHHWLHAISVDGLCAKRTCLYSLYLCKSHETLQLCVSFPAGAVRGWLLSLIVLHVQGLSAYGTCREARGKPSDVNKRYCCKHCYSWKIHHLVAFDFWNTTWPRQAACTTDFCGLPPVSLHSHINIAYLWTHH